MIHKEFVMDLPDIVADEVYNFNYSATNIIEDSGIIVTGYDTSCRCLSVISLPSNTVFGTECEYKDVIDDLDLPLRSALLTFSMNLSLYKEYLGTFSTYINVYARDYKSGEHYLIKFVFNYKSVSHESLNSKSIENE